MTIPHRIPALGIILCVIIVVVTVNAFLLHGWLGHVVTGVFGGHAGTLSASISSARLYVGQVFSGTDPVKERLRFAEEVARLQANSADTEALRRELAIAQAAVSIRDRVRGTMLEAGLTAMTGDGGARSALINRGAQDGVTTGTVVVSATGALVGVVREVFRDHATLVMVGDPGLQVTGRVLSSEITGLVRVDAAEGLLLDLVHKDEPITEGQIVVTSGNDQFPAGFVIGTVRSVDAQRTTLFAVVRVTPAAGTTLGRVLLLRP